MTIDNPPPALAGATRVDEWGKSWRGHICRTVFVPIGVAIAGIQYADDDARRAIHLKDLLDGPLTPGQARGLAAALTAAADECHTLAADELAARK